MFPNMMPNYQWNNNNNNFNCFNNFNNMGFFPNTNMNVPGLNMGGVAGWQDLYNISNQNQNINQMQNNGTGENFGKVNCIFRTTRGMKLNIFIEFGKTVKDLIKLYFTRVEQPQLFNNPEDIFFIYNANKIDFNEQKPVEQYFGLFNAFITVNDTKGLIGA